MDRGKIRLEDSFIAEPHEGIKTLDWLVTLAQGIEHPSIIVPMVNQIREEEEIVHKWGTDDREWWIIKTPSLIYMAQLDDLLEDAFTDDNHVYYLGISVYGYRVCEASLITDDKTYDIYNVYVTKSKQTLVHIAVPHGEYNRYEVEEMALEESNNRRDYEWDDPEYDYDINLDCEDVGRTYAEQNCDNYLEDE